MRSATAKKIAPSESGLLEYIRALGLSAEHVSRAPSLLELLGGSPDGLLAGAAPASVPDPDQAYAVLRSLIGHFETGLNADQVTGRGAVYTPDHIVDRLLGDGQALCSDQSRAPRICDPACGSGAFLLGAVMFLEKRFDLSPAQSLARLIRGIDVDGQAVQNARAVLELLLLCRGADPTLAYKSVVKADSLLTPPATLRRAMYGQGGSRPQLICTNPPYVKVQNLDPAVRRKLQQTFGEALHGSYSLSIPFALRCLDLVEEDGLVAMITQNNLFTSMAGKAIRSQLQERRVIRRIVDFGHRRVFPGASAYTCLLYLGGSPDHDFDYARISDSDVRRGLRKTTYSRIRFDQLDPGKWRLAPAENLADLRHMEKLPWSLGRLCQIRVGFATLKDKAFFIEELDGLCLGHTPEGEALEVEPELTRPAVKVAALRTQGDLGQNRRRIIYPYQHQGKKNDLISAAELRQSYPRAYRLLRTWREPLLARDKGRVDPRRWFAWGRAQSLTAPGPKLLTKTFNRQPSFFLDPSDSLFCNGYSLTLHPDHAPQGLTLPLLQRVLNSQVMHYFACLTSFHIEGGYQCYQKNFIEHFCLPSLSENEGKRLLDLDSEGFEEGLIELYGLNQNRIQRFIQAYHS